MSQSLLLQNAKVAVHCVNVSKSNTTMLNEHDQDVLLRCRRLGHEVAFGYCRQETAGAPCRLIFDCWWQQFDAKSFLGAHLTPETMARVELVSATAPQPKVLSLLDLIQQAKERVAATKTDSDNSPKG